jgi:hypothetical protein
VVHPCIAKVKKEKNKNNEQHKIKMNNGGNNMALLSCFCGLYFRCVAMQIMLNKVMHHPMEYRDTVDIPLSAPLAQHRGA